MTLDEMIERIWDEAADLLASPPKSRSPALRAARELAACLSKALDAQEAGLPEVDRPMVDEGCVRAAMESTFLLPAARASDVETFVRDSALARCAAVCVFPCHIERARPLLAGSSTLLVTVAGFPFGSNETSVKVHEVSQAVSRGADEVDFVVNPALVKDGEIFALSEEVSLVKCAAGPERKVKAILEVGYLSDEELIRAAVVAVLTGADFIKTSTGFGPRGVLPRDVSLLAKILRSRAGPGSKSRAGIKASGGVRTLAQVRELLARGASRIGTTSALAILRDLGK